MRIILSVGFLACILVANYVTTELGMVPVGFGLEATAGTYVIGVSFILRDLLQDTIRRELPLRTDWQVARPLLLLILLGGFLSFLVADPRIALASAVAFTCSEVADLLIYTPLRRQGFLRALTFSNVVGAVLDTVLFLWIAGFPVLDAFAGQMAGKMAVTAGVFILVLGYRWVRDERRRNKAEREGAEVSA
jgi:uncharacterized PurR-regulated membrane protein YhhQ (DUF165 family)